MGGFSWKWLVLAAASIGLACPFDQPDAPKWNPMGKPFYLVSSFGDLHNGEINLGIDFSTEGQLKQPVQAPENGKIAEVRTGPQGKTIVFQGVSGHRWILAGLQSLSSKALQKNQPDFVEYEIVGYSGNDLHMELHSPDGKQALNPCEIGVACHDTVAPQVVGVATWDVDQPAKGFQFTSPEAFAKGCIQVPADTRNPRFAVQILDLATKGSPHTMGMHYAALRQGTELLYLWETQSLSMESKQLPPEVLWTDHSERAGTWYTLYPGKQKHPGVQGDAEKTATVAKNLIRLPPKRASQKPLTLEIMDHRLNSNAYHFIPRPDCSPLYNPPTFPDSLLFTALGQAWIRFDICEQSAKVSLLDSSLQILARDVCDSLDHVATPVPALLQRWPNTRAITIGSSTGESRRISVLPLHGPPVRSMQDQIFLRLSYSLPHGSSALAWELRKSGLSIHPKGLFLLQPADICIPAQDSKTLEARATSTTPWKAVPSRFFVRPDSTNTLCATLPVLQDLRRGNQP